MHRTLRAALAAFALLALPQFASAGPIPWGYRAVDPNGAVLAEKTGLTDLIWSDFFLPDPRTDGVVVPDPNPNDGVRSDIKRTQATVTITDELSGQTGTFWLYSDYIWEYEINADGSLEPLHEGPSGGPYPEPTNLVLGGNTYSLRAPGGEFMMQLTPGPTALTPEPGTFVLAMCGFGVLGWRVRRRVIA